MLSWVCFTDLHRHTTSGPPSSDYLEFDVARSCERGETCSGCHYICDNKAADCPSVSVSTATRGCDTSRIRLYKVTVRKQLLTMSPIQCRPPFTNPCMTLGSRFHPWPQEDFTRW